MDFEVAATHLWLVTGFAQGGTGSGRFTVTAEPSRQARETLNQAHRAERNPRPRTKMPTDYRSPPASLHPERSLGALSAFSDRTVDVSIDDASSGLEGCDHVENVVAAPSSSARHGRRAGGASAAPLTDLAEDTLDLSASFDQLELSGLEAVRAPPAAAEEYAEEEFLEHRGARGVVRLVGSAGSARAPAASTTPRRAPPHARWARAR